MGLGRRFRVVGKPPAGYAGRAVAMEPEVLDERGGVAAQEFRRRGVGRLVGRRDDGGPESVDGRGDRGGRAQHGRGREPRSRGGQERASGVARDHSRRARGAALQARRPDRRERGGACGPRVQKRRQAPVLRTGRDARVRGQHPLFRRCGARARRSRGRRVHAGLYVHAPARADRRRRRHRSLELPAHDGRLEVLARARGRERPGAEAVRADAALASPLHGARRRRAPAGRAQRHHRRRRARRRGAGQAS